jgi:hypothetical protein
MRDTAGEHIPDDSDLVLVELGINDLVDTEVYGAYEHLIRSLLELDTKPAIINVEYVPMSRHSVQSAADLRISRPGYSPLCSPLSYRLQHCIRTLRPSTTSRQ